MQVPQEARGIGTPEAVVTGGSEPLDTGAGDWTWIDCKSKMTIAFCVFEIRSNHGNPPASAFQVLLQE